MDEWMGEWMDVWMDDNCCSKVVLAEEEEEEEEGRRVCLWMKVGTLVHPGWPYCIPLN
jgi:hypothetical protein